MAQKNFVFRFALSTIIAAGTFGATYKTIQFLATPTDNKTPEQRRSSFIEIKRNENIQQSIDEQLRRAEAHVQKSIAERGEKDKITVAVVFEADFNKATTDAAQAYDRLQKIDPYFNGGMAGLFALAVGGYAFSKLRSDPNEMIARYDDFHPIP